MALMGGPGLFWFWVVCCDASFLCGLFVCLGRPKSRADAWGSRMEPSCDREKAPSSKKQPTREPTLAAPSTRRPIEAR